MLAGRTVPEGKQCLKAKQIANLKFCVAPVRLPEKLDFSGDFTGMSGDFTALLENVPGEICLPHVAGLSRRQAAE
jgi:hypothetical protein